MDSDWEFSVTSKRRVGTIRLEESVQRGSASKGKEDRKDNDMTSNTAGTFLPRTNPPFLIKRI